MRALADRAVPLYLNRPRNVLSLAVRNRVTVGAFLALLAMLVIVVGNAACKVIGC